jgi:hypothetical protein
MLVVFTLVWVWTAASVDAVTFTLAVLAETVADNSVNSANLAGILLITSELPPKKLIAWAF